MARHQLQAWDKLPFYGTDLFAAFLTEEDYGTLCGDVQRMCLIYGRPMDAIVTSAAGATIYRGALNSFMVSADGTSEPIIRFEGN